MRRDRFAEREGMFRPKEKPKQPTEDKITQRNLPSVEERAKHLTKMIDRLELLKRMEETTQKHLG